MSNATIIYTHTDEAPALATYSFLPVIQHFAKACGVTVETRDISLAGRILSAFSDRLPKDKVVTDALAELGALAQRPEANIIKLPNISASVPQMKAVIAELQNAGYPIPDFVEDPKSDEERDILARYNKVKGSAVNPVLREGNSDRRAPKAVKAYAKRHPHSMGEWSKDARAQVATMTSGDFKNSELSTTVSEASELSITLHPSDGEARVLKSGIAVDAHETIDATRMQKAALLEFLDAQFKRAKDEGLLYSLHMKATMMKVSDPIIFGHAVRSYFKPLFEKHGETFEGLGVEVNNGFGDLLDKISTLPPSGRSAIEADIQNCLEAGPDLAMVDSDRGISNLHVPSDVIIDASMPAMVRSSGCMWNKDGKLQDALAIIPDSSYAPVYQEVLDFCRENGTLDPTTLGTVPNVGLMAKKAEEYGSHDKTFEIDTAGTVKVTDKSGVTLFEHTVKAGDIWRMCQVKDVAVRDWVKLAVNRARATQDPTVFWLDQERAHDAELIKKVEVYLKDHNTEGLDIRILTPKDATRLSLERMVKGENTISVTGNVLRDYNTDLFPILELGTSAKMLSIVPLLAGGGLFETGAGGSAPKHVQQFEKENHLRWDSLGEFLALAVSLDHLAERFDNKKAKIMGDALDEATTQYLLNNKSPSRKVLELDNRGSHFYVAMYWAQALAEQKDDAELGNYFTELHQKLQSNEEKIVQELKDAQGKAMDIGGYYFPDTALAEKAMRPSETFNSIMA